MTDRGSISELPNAAHLAAIVESSDDAIISTDLNGLILSWNPAAERIYGYARSEAIGQPITMLFPHDRLSEESVNLQKIRQGQRVDPYDTVRKHKDGTAVVVSLAVSPIKDSAGRIIGASKTARNITELRRIEEELRALTVALDQRVAQRTAALTQSQTRLRALASELSLAEERVRRKLATELHDYLGQMLVTCRLKLAGGAAGAQELAAAQREADLILKEAIAYTRSLVAQLTPPVLREFGLVSGLTWLADQMKQHALHVELTIGIPTVELPEQQAILLFQSVRELLMNVVKHAGSSYATLAIEKVQGQLSLTVNDRGKGFDVASPHNTGEPHFGLFSIRERMEGIGGHFEILSTPQQGTTARLLLPLGPSPTISDRPSASKTLSPLRSEPLDVPGVRILLVDDHPLVRQGIRGVVEGFDKMEVVGEASNGKEAIELALSLRPDVVIMDVNMPVMNGVGATRVIKAQCPDIIVVGLSVNNDRQIQAAMNAAGASAYLTKDTAPELLGKVISEALGLKFEGPTLFNLSPNSLITSQQ